MVEADVVDLVRRVRTRVEGRGDYPREITQGISEEIGERPDRPVAGRDRNFSYCMTKRRVNNRKLFLCVK
jgi:hypothetical protein